MMLRFSFADGTGEANPALVGSGGNIVFILDIDEVGVSMTDFIEQNSMGSIGTARSAIGCVVLGTASRRRL